MDVAACRLDPHVGVRRGSRLFIDANTVSGSTSSEVELSDAPREPAGDDAPLVELFVKTVSGDVHIERAPSSTPTAELTESS